MSNIRIAGADIWCLAGWDGGAFVPPRIDSPEG